ncbi:hypothetical protein, partial [Nostoc sp. UHCC 0251]|uniref:hypothetical protein n=1 Tax=Nostoc sp. UHCC 0251 TaxID=3110240 RepID=UPI002B1FB54C
GKFKVSLLLGERFRERFSRCREKSDAESIAKLLLCVQELPKIRQQTQTWKSRLNLTFKNYELR